MRARSLDLLCFVIIVVLTLFCALSPIWEMDVFWHVAVGRHILDTGALPTTNIWSAADPAQPYHSLYWMWDLAMAWLDRSFGLEAVRLANAGWIVATFGALYVVLRKLGRSRAEAVLFSLALLAAFHDRIRVRPHVINLAAEIALTLYVTRLRHAKLWHALPACAVFFVWAGMHTGGAWAGVMGLAGLALVIFVVEIVERRPQCRLPVLVVALGAALGWLLNPESFVSLSTYADASPSSPEMLEFAAWPAITGRASLESLPHLVVARLFNPLAAVLWVLVAVEWWRRVRPTEAIRHAVGHPYELVLAAYFLVLAFMFWRLFYLSVLALLLIQGVHERHRGHFSQNAPPPMTPRKRLMPWLASAALALVTIHYEIASQFVSLSESLKSRFVTVDERYFPAVLTRMLSESGIHGRVATTSSWGGYVLYHAYPRMRVTLDGRNVAPDEILAISNLVIQIRNSGQRMHLLSTLYDRLPADFLLMPSPAFQEGASTGDWAFVAKTEHAELFARRGPDLGAWMERFKVVVEKNRAAQSR